MWIKIIAFLAALSPWLVAKIMALIGFTIFSYGGITTLFNAYIDNSQNVAGLINGPVHALLNIAGFDQSMAIITSALVSRMGIMILSKIKMTGTGLVP